MVYVELDSGLPGHNTVQLATMQQFVFAVFLEEVDACRLDAR